VVEGASLHQGFDDALFEPLTRGDGSARGWRRGA